MIRRLVNSVIVITPALASLVKNITIELSQQITSLGSAFILDVLLLRLSGLRSLVIVSSRQDTSDLVSRLERLGSATLPQLEYLEFWTRSSWTNPLLPVHYVFLASFPALKRLVIHCDNAGIGSPGGGGTENPVIFSNSINSLKIVGSARAHRDIADMCSGLPRLHSLDLRARTPAGPRANYNNLLQRLPTSLTSLSLLDGGGGVRSLGGVLRITQAQMDEGGGQYLPRFTRLQHLVVGPDVITLEGIENVLRHLPHLRTVSFSESTPIKLDQARMIFSRVQQVVVGLEKIQRMGKTGWVVSRAE